jgi:endonuclease/exonuclease/phosphatase family metal-dependent hydrolase
MMNSNRTCMILIFAASSMVTFVPTATLAGIVLSTDFTGRTVSGPVVSNIPWITTGVEDPGDLTAIGPNLVFDTADAQNHFAPDRNIDNEGPWSVDVPLVLAAGVPSITLDDVVLGWQHFNNAGNFQTASRSADWTVTVTGSSSGLLGTCSARNVAGIRGLEKLTFDSPLILPSTETYVLNISVRGTTVGNNTGLYKLTVNDSPPASWEQWPYPAPAGQVRLMSWNIEFLNTRTPPRTADQLDLLAQRIAGFDAGIIALQEITQLSVLEDIAANLGPTWEVLSTSGQQTAILYDQSKVTLISGGTLTTLSASPYTTYPGVSNRKPITGVFEPVGGGDPFRVIGVHCHPSDWSTSQAEGQWLNEELRALLDAADGPEDIFVVGDYNNSSLSGPMITELLQGDVVSLLRRDGGQTMVLSSVVLDYCAVTPGALARVPKASSFAVNCMDYGESPEDFEATYSDHYPIVVDLNVPEPATLALLALSGSMLLRRQKD